MLWRYSKCQKWDGVSNALGTRILGNPRFVRLPPFVTLRFSDKETIRNKSQYISVWLTVKHSLAHAAHTSHRRGSTAQSHLPSRRLYTLQVSTNFKIHIQCNLSEFFPIQYFLLCAICKWICQFYFYLVPIFLCVIQFPNFNLGLVTGNLDGLPFEFLITWLFLAVPFSVHRVHITIPRVRPKTRFSILKISPYRMFANSILNLFLCSTHASMLGEDNPSGVDDRWNK